MVSIVIGRWSANGRGCGAAGTGLRGGHGGRLKRAAVEGSRLEGAARGAVALGQRGGGGLENSRQNHLHSDQVKLYRTTCFISCWIVKHGQFCS